jgi:hypothetical protein
MRYSEHYEKIKLIFQEDLLQESEFDLIEHSEAAMETVDLCIQLCDDASRKLNIQVHFGVAYNLKFNASAKIKDESAAIIFNLGLIDKLETIISSSIELFMYEDIANITIGNYVKDNLKTVVKNCCVTYLFNHELAHVLQLLDKNVNANCNLQELYSYESVFDIKNHIYEMDADHFGSLMSAHFLINKIIDSNFRYENVLLFNSLTLLLFTMANILIEFSGNTFQNIYYRQNSHPHPLIRIVKCKEQILFFISKNLNVNNSLLTASLQRTGTMISQIAYSDKRKINYPKLINENLEDISNYIAEIEKLDQDYKELIRHKAQVICDALVN